MSDADKPESLGFDFAPDWARKSADEYVSRYQGRSYDERTGREGRPPRDGSFRDRPPRRDGDRPRPPRRDGDGERRFRREGPEGERRFPRRDGEADGYHGYPRGPRSDSGRPFVYREPVRPLDAEIRILPNQKNLGVIIKTLQGTHVAFPVKKFVNLFLENPQACLVRFEAKPETDTLFWSCKACGLVTLSEAELFQHLLACHLNDSFDVAEESCDPPSGTYPCVAKCTLTGEWVGAPNHHSYKHRVAELAARAGMDERDYLRTVEMCRDTESIEAWKQSVTTHTVYRPKVAKPAEENQSAETPAAGENQPVAESAPEASVETRPTYTRDQAEAIFRRDVLPTLIASAKHVCLPVSMAQTSPSLPLRLLLKYTLRDEQRYPRSLFFALRGAFRHRKFTLFRSNDARGPEFVANMMPTPFTAEHVVRELASALKFVAEHPLCTRAELLVALKGELVDMDPGIIARQIAFLFQKGHIVEYYNGVLALPEVNPKFRKLPEEMKREREAAGVEPVRSETSEATPTPETSSTVENAAPTSEASVSEVPVATECAAPVSEIVSCAEDFVPEVSAPVAPIADEGSVSAPEIVLPPESIPVAEVCSVSEPAVSEVTTTDSMPEEACVSDSAVSAVKPEEAQA